MQELASAVNAGVEIVLITKEGSRWPNRNGDMVEVFPPPELIDALDPPECRAAFARRAITHTNEYYAAFSHNLMQTVETMIKQHRQQHGNPPAGQDNPDRLVIAQRRQLMLARSQSAELSQGLRGSSTLAGGELAIVTLEAALSSPVALVDVERLEMAIDAAGNDSQVDSRLLAAAKHKLERAHAQAKYTLKEKQAAAKTGTACEFCFLRVAVLLSRNANSLTRHQSIEEDPEMYVWLYLTSAECCQHQFREKVLVVSHRWDRPDEPDPSGAQMKALKRVLRANPQYEYVWVVRASRRWAPVQNTRVPNHADSRCFFADSSACERCVTLRRTFRACHRARVRRRRRLHSSSCSRISTCSSSEQGCLFSSTCRTSLASGRSLRRG